MINQRLDWGEGYLLRAGEVVREYFSPFLKNIFNNCSLIYVIHDLLLLFFNNCLLFSVIRDIMSQNTDQSITCRRRWNTLVVKSIYRSLEMKHPFLSRAYSWNSKYSKNGCVLYTWRQTLCFTGGQTRNTEKSKTAVCSTRGLVTKVMQWKYSAHIPRLGGGTNYRLRGRGRGFL